MLELIELPGTKRSTTRLGFGCSGLMGGLSERESLRLLQTAYEEGIRHFDVAPSYGHGFAEHCVGKFLRGKADTTITTKYGILPPAQAGLLEIARTAVRPLAAQFPWMRERAAKRASALKSKARFCAEEARSSLEGSLRKLQVERVDFWLLHEVTAEDLAESDLLPQLNAMQGKGKIGMHGVGAERRKLDRVWQSHREYCPVAQYEWSILESGETRFPGAFCIQHRAVSGALPALQKAMERDPELCRRWSDSLNADLSHAEDCAALLVNLALLRNPDGIILFSSRNVAHIQAHARACGSVQWKLRATRFHELLRTQ